MRIATKLSNNNQIMHFEPESGLKVEGATEFSDIKTIRRSPLVENIFDIGGVSSIVITPEAISVKKQDTADWQELRPQILAEITEYLLSGEDIITAPQQKEMEDVVKNIIGLIDARIRPAVQKDGGEIAFKDFRNGIVYVEMLGKCATCPYSQNTLKERIEKVIKTYIKEVQAVERFESI